MFSTILKFFKQIIKRMKQKETFFLQYNSIWTFLRYNKKNRDKGKEKQNWFKLQASLKNEISQENNNDNNNSAAVAALFFIFIT